MCHSESEVRQEAQGVSVISDYSPELLSEKGLISGFTIGAVYLHPQVESYQNFALIENRTIVS